MIAYTPIGVVHSPFTDIAGMPIQPAGAEGVRGTVEIAPAYTAGLRDLDGFSHVILLYHFHRVTETRLTVTPFLDDTPRGVFATRAPMRPNPIGLSIVKLERVEGNVLHIANVDILDGTPVLDVKPYVPTFDAQGEIRTGWLAQSRHDVTKKESDDRFRP